MEEQSAFGLVEATISMCRRTSTTGSVEGFNIAPVPLDIRGLDPALVGWGSYIVNAQGGCNDCHTVPSYAPGGDPFRGERERVNADQDLAGGCVRPVYVEKSDSTVERAAGESHMARVPEDDAQGNRRQGAPSGNLAAPAGHALAGFVESSEYRCPRRFPTSYAPSEHDRGDETQRRTREWLINVSIPSDASCSTSTARTQGTSRSSAASRWRPTSSRTTSARTTCRRSTWPNIKWTPGKATIGIGMGKECYQWIKAAFDKGYMTKSGSITAADFNYKAMSVQTFRDALITSVTVPKLDGSSKDAAYFDLEFEAEQVRWAKGGGEDIRGKVGPKQKAWLCSNFRVEMGGLPCNRVASVDAFTWKCAVAADQLGVFREPTKHPAKVTVPDIKLVDLAWPTTRPGPRRPRSGSSTASTSRRTRCRAASSSWTRT